MLSAPVSLHIFRLYQVTTATAATSETAAKSLEETCPEKGPEGCTAGPVQELHDKSKDETKFGGAKTIFGGFPMSFQASNYPPIN